MHYKIMIAGDLHKRMKDGKILGYTRANFLVQTDLMRAIDELGITHFISLGDWFDRGYGSDVAAALTHTDIDREMALRLKGNFYGLIGNHIRLVMDSNPELFLIQPHPRLKSRHAIARDYQILRTPDSLRLGPIQFCFAHWSKDADTALDYKVMIDPTAKYHIGLYHTEKIIPASKLSDLNMYSVVSSNNQISAALEGIDIAIVGHIHMKIGTFSVSTPSGDIPMIIPGSLTNTSSSLIERHDYIEIPIIETDDDSDSFSLSYYKQPLHTDILQFLHNDLEDTSRTKLKSLQGNSVETLYEELETASFIGSGQFLSLNRFLEEQGYTQGDKKIIKHVINSPEDVTTLLNIYKEDTRWTE